MADKYGYLDFAEDVLKESTEPLLYQEIWDAGKTKSFLTKLKTKGKTPWASLGAYLYVDVRDNPDSRFIKVGKLPARFFLKANEASLGRDIGKVIVEKELKESTSERELKYNERDLHALLSCFAYTNVDFNKGRAIYTKTIFHEKTKKTGYNEWVHPDLVGFYIPIDDWNEKLIEFNKISDSNSISLYSFEMKKQINKSNYREYYFQAVSNSSWANEGYLVAADIKQDDDLLAELERLSASFGIGLIHIDLEDFESSRVLFQAKRRSTLDWALMNKLCEQNADFESFIDNVSKDYTVKRITRQQYDAIIEDADDYISKMKK